MFPENSKLFKDQNISSLNGCILLFNIKNGLGVSLMDANFITGRRT